MVFLVSVEGHDKSGMVRAKVAKDTELPTADLPKAYHICVIAHRACMGSGPILLRQLRQLIHRKLQLPLRGNAYVCL